MYQSIGKRLFDIITAFLALAVLWPVMAIVGLAIRGHDGGPALFRQQRVGKNGSFFVIFKFRSMPVATPHLPSDQAKALAVTPVGKFIRRTNLDELPQLFNVLFGDMSVVGPRPALASQVALCLAREANGAAKLRPGLTGLAQVQGYDGMSVEHKASLDGNYARSVTLVNDLKIILLTFGYLFKEQPVY